MPEQSPHPVNVRQGVESFVIVEIKSAFGSQFKTVAPDNDHPGDFSEFQFNSENLFQRNSEASFKIADFHPGGVRPPEKPVDHPLTPGKITPQRNWQPTGFDPPAVRLHRESIDPELIIKQCGR